MMVIFLFPIHKLYCYHKLYLWMENKGILIPLSYDETFTHSWQQISKECGTLS